MAVAAIPSLPSLRRQPARARLGALADAGSLEDLDVPRASPWLARFGIAAQADDGVAIAALAIAGARFLAAAQDERFVGGSIGAHHGEALEALFRRAVAERPAGVLLLLASGGVRLHEANAAELAAGRALRALLDARAEGIPVFAVAVGDVFGGAAVLACAATALAMVPTARIGLSGPRVIETARGAGELDAADAAAVEALFGARTRSAAGDVELVDDAAEAIRAWVAGALRGAAAFEAQVAAAHARLAARAAGVPAAFARPPLFGGRRDAIATGTGGRLWRVGTALVTVPFTDRAFDGVSVHALDGELLALAAALPSALVVTEDSTGHEVSCAAEARFDARLLAHHAAVLALLRRRGVRTTGLLLGTCQGAAFFVNALQPRRRFAVAGARVVAMDAAAVARVTGREIGALVDDDPLLGGPVRHFAALGGVDRIVVDAAQALDAALRR